ncbi:MAG TPA: response regulator transcription factor [Casimicrobiaceae bacterium]|jgi:DNA-binding response OmpR family regulator
MRLLVIEDDFALSEVLVYSLRQVGYAVDCIDDGLAADALLRHERFDLIVLDLGLPKLDGLDLLRRLRADGSATPVLILSARDADEERVQGLDSGADDYLVKPFSINELEARVRALLRRSHNAHSARMRHARLSFDTVSRTVTTDDVAIDLSAREVSLLEALFVHFGHIVSKERLLEQVYGYEGDVGLNTIEVYVHRLRKKIAGSGVSLRTIHGRGYVLEMDDARAPIPSAAAGIAARSSLG